MEERPEGPLPHLILKQICHGVIGVACMQDQRQIRAPGSVHMGQQGAELFVTRRIPVMEVQTRLTNPDDFGMLRDFNEFVGGDVRSILGMMGVRADCAPDVVMPLCDTGNIFEIRQSTTNGDHAADAGRASPVDDLIEILGELLAMKIDVTVDPHAQTPAFSLRATSRTWPSALKIVCLGSR